MSLFFETHANHLVLIPTISIVIGSCECCDNEGGLMIAIDFGIWSFGMIFSKGGCSHE